MNRIAKIFSLVTAGLILISSCNDKGTDSPFGEILSQTPYTGLTDSIKQEPENDELFFAVGLWSEWVDKSTGEVKETFTLIIFSTSCIIQHK